MLFVVVIVVVVAVPHWWDFLRWGIGSCIVPFIFVTLCSSNRKKKKGKKRKKERYGYGLFLMADALVPILLVTSQADKIWALNTAQNVAGPSFSPRMWSGACLVLSPVPNLTHSSDSPRQKKL